MVKDSVVIIDYGSGNLRSAEKAFQAAARAAGRDVHIHVSARPEDVAAAARIVLPGQGAFGDCLRGLTGIAGMREALEESVRRKARPFLGICVGMQLMAERGFEHGEHRGLGWIGGDVMALAPVDKRLKIPHMGWNGVDFTAPRHAVLQRARPDEHYYFVHSFVFQCRDTRDILGTTDYGGACTAIVGRETMIGVQFHPEKSQNAGLALIADFLDWDPDTKVR